MKSTLATQETLTTQETSETPKTLKDVLQKRIMKFADHDQHDRILLITASNILSALDDETKKNDENNKLDYKQLNVDYNNLTWTMKQGPVILGNIYKIDIGTIKFSAYLSEITKDAKKANFEVKIELMDLRKPNSDGKYIDEHDHAADKKDPNSEVMEYYIRFESNSDDNNDDKDVSLCKDGNTHYVDVGNFAGGKLLSIKLIVTPCDKKVA